MVGGYRLVYEDNPGSLAASMLETKILLSSIISDSEQGERLMIFDIKYFFLATPMLPHKYMKMHICPPRKILLKNMI